MRYKKVKFYRVRRERLKIINQIIVEYQRYLPLTLRQLWYLFISKELPKDIQFPNKYSGYNSLSEQITLARYAGLIEFDIIEDRTAYTSNLPISIDECMSYYYPEAWEDQDNYIEVIVEKDAMSRIFTGFLRKYYVPINFTKGYLSTSQAMEIAERFNDFEDKNRYIYAFTDFDPEGENMIEVIEEKVHNSLWMLGEDSDYPTVEKVALNMDQIINYNIPLNNLEKQNSRVKKFKEKHGDNIAELDALKPQIIYNLLRDSVLSKIDMSIVEEIREEERKVKTVRVGDQGEIGL